MKRIVFPARKTTRILFLILGVLVVLHLFVAFCHLVLHVRVGALTELVDLDLESNLPTFFNALLFFVGSALLYLHGRAGDAKQGKGWAAMALIFVFLGLDEGSQIHEKFMGFTQRLLARGQIGEEAGSWLLNAWVVPYVLALGVLAFILWRWFWRLAPSLRKGLLISGGVYVFGAVGMEMAGSKLIATLPGQDASAFPWLPCDLYGDPSGCWLFMEPRYILLYTLEEVGEMTGLILCIRTLLRHFEANGTQLSLSLAKAE